MLAALCGQNQAKAQGQKIATINMQQALAETADGKKAVADLRAKFGPKDQDFQRRSQELQATQEKLRKTQNTISEEAKAKLESDIASMTRNLQRDSDDTKADMEAEEQKMVQELGGKIMQVINKYAADNLRRERPAQQHHVCLGRCGYHARHHCDVRQGCSGNASRRTADGIQARAGRPETGWPGRCDAQSRRA